MRFPSPKIKFYRIRTFGEKINISFDFLRETWKPFIKFSLYLILPICLFQAFAMNAYMRFAFSLGAGDVDGGFSGFLSSFMASYGILMVCVLLGSCLLSALVYTLMQEYERRETRLLDITFSDFRSLLLRNLFKSIGVSLFTFLITILVGVLIGLLTALSPWTLILTIPLFLIGLFVVMVPVSYFIPIYIFEDLPFFTSLQKSFKIGFSVWGETFAVLLVFSLLGSIINSLTTMPWYLVMIFGELFSLADPESGVNSTLWYQLVIYLLGILQSYGMYLSYIISGVGLAFQYFHVREKKEGISMKSSIENFDQL